MTKRYQATARINGKKVWLGRCDTEAERDALRAAALADVERGTIYDGKLSDESCKQCQEPAIADPNAFGRCPKHLRRLRQLQGTYHDIEGDDEVGGDTVDFDEWCILRGYDPVTRTYKDDPAPLARLDGEWLA